jgi:SAM-dependent methyltransferase
MRLSANLADALCCPDCGTDLHEIIACSGCGRKTDVVNGIPSLFPSPGMSRRISLPLGLTDPRSIDRSVYAVPPQHGQRGSPVYHLDHAHVRRLQDLPPGALVLETGCGGGQMRKWVEAQGLRYLGTDVSTERVHEWLRDSGGADLLCDAHALPLRDATVDAVYAAAVYEHLAFPILAASEAARVLKPGGLHLGSMSFLEPWHDESYAHMTPNGIYAMLVSAGLKPVAIWPEVAWPGFVSMLRMGNKATKPLTGFGRLLNFVYLAPARIKHLARRRALPDDADLHAARSAMAGAIAWIAEKP